MTDIPDLSRPRPGDADHIDRDYGAPVVTRHCEKTPPGGGGGGTTPEATFTLQYANFQSFNPPTGFSYTSNPGTETGYNPPNRFGETIRGLLDAKFEVFPALDENWTFRQVGETHRFEIGKASLAEDYIAEPFQANDPSKPAELLLVLNYDFDLADPSVLYTLSFFSFPLVQAAPINVANAAAGSPQRGPRAVDVQNPNVSAFPGYTADSDPDFLAYFQTGNSLDSPRGSSEQIEVDGNLFTVELEPIIFTRPNRDPISEYNAATGTPYIPLEERPVTFTVTWDGVA